MKHDGLKSVELVKDKPNKKAWLFKFDEEAGQLPRMEVDELQLIGANITVKVITNHDTVALREDEGHAKRKARVTKKLKRR